MFIKKSEEKARLQYNELAKTKENAADELKKSVYQNYPVFISTSKEISSIITIINLQNMDLSVPIFGSGYARSEEFAYRYGICPQRNTTSSTQI